MSSMDDKNLPAVAGASTGTALALVRQDEPAAAAGPQDKGAADSSSHARALRWVIPAVLIALTGGVGWYAGAQSNVTALGLHRSQINEAIDADLRAQSAALAALDARLKRIESAPGAEASIKPAIEILAQRIDEIARKQTAALTQTANRLDRSDKDVAARFDRLAERMERIEKQVSAAAPVGAVQKNVTAVTRAAPDAVAKAEEPEAKAVRGYVLRDVFRGGALVESRYGLMEVFPGVQLPGAGRVRSVEKRDGRWVVVTTAGLIEARR
ncbi:MAG: hypothetical protein ACK4MV_19575 [Beijerinckiaceae bacterium]